MIDDVNGGGVVQDSQERSTRFGLGALSLFGICVLLVAAASQMISVEDPNAPVALVYDDPIVSSPTPSVGKVVGGPDAQVAVEVFGVSVTSDDAGRLESSTAGGVTLGRWESDRRTSAGDYLLVQTADGVWLVFNDATGSGERFPLRELPYSNGRFFAFTGDAQGDYLVLGDDGRLSLGDLGGVYATLDALD